MRKKISEVEKRSKIIGIKVKEETRQKIKFIANRECTQLSTYIDSLLVKHINEYLSHAHINWDTLTEEEKEGREVNERN